MGSENVESFPPGYFKRNENELRGRLAGIGKEIIADIRKNEHLNKTLSFIFESLELQLDEEMHKNIDNIWSKYELAQKAKNLLQMQDNATNTQPAWRPKTGNYDIRPYKQRSLQKKLESLQIRYAENQKAIGELELHIVTLREKVDKVTEDMIKQTLSSP